MAVFLGIFIALATGGQGDINPAISLVKHLLGVSYPELTQLGAVMLAQTLGGFAGGIFVWLAYYPHWEATSDPDFKLMVFSTMPAIRRPPFNFITELLGTLVLVLGVGAIVKIDQASPMSSGFLAYSVGMLVWGIGLSLGGPTGYAIILHVTLALAWHTHFCRLLKKEILIGPMLGFQSLDPLLAQLLALGCGE